MQIVIVLISIIIFSQVSNANIGEETGLEIPRYVSLKSDDANIRVGPSKNYPIEIKYIKKNYPLKVLEEYEEWRKVEDFKKMYKEGKVGDFEVKKDLANALNQFLSPIREKREYYENNPKMVEDALLSGTNNARKIASETMRMVRSAMKIDSYTSKC